MDRSVVQQLLGLIHEVRSGLHTGLCCEGQASWWAVLAKSNPAFKGTGYVIHEPASAGRR